MMNAAPRPILHHNGARMNPREVATVPDGGETAETDLPSRLGHFEIVGRLGSGGMGLVFEGRDTVLGRRVALKLLHPGRVGNPIAPARLLREAQALAKLSHRNVVTVYEVGMAGDDPFVAMELVEGETLATWMKQRRDWRAVLDVFIAAGHGLAAVHALGLVHRDFKPSNVLFDKDGTPKLGDFGLVRPVEAPPEPVEPGAPSDSKLTETGSVMGTPAYMSPEQRLGLRVDARADQYSFAKSLREALGEQIPTKLQPILARALADDSDERYPSMTPLLDDLARVRRGNRARWIGAGATVALLGAVGMAWAFGRAQSADDPCPRPTDRIAKVWSPARRDALQAHLLMIDPMLGAQRFTVANAVFDRGADRWMNQHVDACESSHAGRQSGALLDRRMSCLDRALLEIDDTVAVLEKAVDRFTLDNAMKATTSLPALDDCADVKALTELLPRPTNPVQRAEADALTRELVDIDVARRTGGTKTTHAEERAAAAVARARKLGDPETLARALRSLSDVQVENEAGEASFATYKEAITAASAAHDDRMAADLWGDYLRTLVSLNKTPEARTLMPAAEAANARAKSNVRLQVRLLNVKSLVALADGDVNGAKAAVDEALAILEAAGSNAPGSSLREQVIEVKDHAGRLFAAKDDFRGFADNTRDNLALANEMYGPDHPVTMRLHFNLGIAHRRLGDEEAALKEFREAARIGEARLAPSPSLADYLFGVGSTLLAMERVEDATPYLERSVAMARSTLPPGDARLAGPVSALAAAYTDGKRFDEALPLLHENIAILEKRGGEPDEKLGIAYWNLGNWATLSHHCDEGWAPLDKALAYYRQHGTADDVHSTLILIAECQLDVERFADAVRTTEMILSAKEASDDAAMIASFDHGKAIAFMGRREAGIAEVRKARETMVKRDKPEDVALADLWLSKWAKPGAVWPLAK